ncbi:hypothetical protein WMO40_19440 [Bacillaceae bacterium CLA-AA-H227]|uniref:Uncharacterized protein n=1 Tax=Robertmurraya yapensis (ex Hitch et al 2024) TaxID=3133160 RepID=A0ACC6SFT3_9BACI
MTFYSNYGKIINMVYVFSLVLSAAGSIPAIILSIVLIYCAVKLEVLPMQNRYIGLKTVIVGMLVNFSCDALKMVAPALG